MFSIKKIFHYFLIFVLFVPIFFPGGNLAIPKAQAATSNQQSTGSNQTNATHQDPKPVTASCGNGCINSGYTVYLQCPTTTDINNATATDSTHYQLSLNWSISFTPEDNEYINSAHVNWTGDPNDYSNLDVQKLSGTKTGTATQQLVLDHGYMPDIEVDVYSTNTGTREGVIVSNICQFTKYSNLLQNGSGNQNSGGNLGTGGAVNNGSTGSNCTCKLSSVSTILSAFMDPVCNIMCVFINAIMDIIDDTIGNWLTTAIQAQAWPRPLAIKYP
ncbi:MAG: hypothetical protein ABSE91_01180 [Patescibacteria group bacterium]|jgi:hypothetical protein